MFNKVTVKSKKKQFEVMKLCFQLFVIKKEWVRTIIVDLIIAVHYVASLRIWTDILWTKKNGRGPQKALDIRIIRLFWFYEEEYEVIIDENIEYLRWIIMNYR